MKKKILTLIAAMAVAVPLWAAKTGSYYKDAATLKFGKATTAKLVSEYDEFEKEYDADSGVYWYKMKLTRGQAYTVWITGGNAADIAFDIDTDTEDDDAPMASFDIVEINGGATQVAYMYADEWDEEDKSATYYVSLYGDVGMSTSINATTGIRNFSTVGDENSPKTLSFSTTEKKLTGKCIDGEYHIKSTLKAGCKYRIRTTNGKETAPVSIDVDSEVDYEMYEDPTYTNSVNAAYNDAFVIVPETSGAFNITISGSADASSFIYYYRQVPKLALGSHKAFTLKEENGFSATFQPGRISSSENYYDEIIDEHLCVVTLEKDQVAVFDGVGADKEVEMIAYDTTGAIIARNSSIGDGSMDVRTAIKASKAGKYYVGVYDPDVGIWDVPDCAEIDLTVRFGDEFPAADDWDPADDEYTSATVLTAWPVTVSTDVEVASIITNATTKTTTNAKTGKKTTTTTYTYVNQYATTNALVFAEDTASTLGSTNGPHAFNGTDWYDVFALPCRSGFAYQLQTSFVDPSDSSDLILGYKVFTLNGTKEVNQSANITEISEDGGLVDGIILKATVNAMHYIRVYVKNTRGLDYPLYTMHAAVSAGKNPLALYSVESRGVAATFSIGSETVKYPTGITIALSSNSDKKFTFNAVSGFTTPAARTLTVADIKPWALADSEGYDPAEQPVNEIVVDYKDIYDSKYAMGTTTTTKNGKKTTTTTYSPADGDATVAGAFTIVATNSVKNYKRSFFADDPQDTMKFASVAGWQYNISIEDTTCGGAGDAVMTVSNSVLGVVADNVTSISKLPLPKGVNWVMIRHADDNARIDSSYTLKTSAANVGLVKFASKTYSVKESQASVALVVKRTASGGAQTVYWATEEGTAKPGSEYYPASGTLAWASGNKADKTITVDLIPDLTPVYESSKTFRVRLWTKEAVDLEAAEYPVVFSDGFDAATVTLTEATAANPGTISIAAYGASEADATNAVANAAKPVVSTEVGDPLVIKLSRTVGTNGNVAVKLTTPVVKTDTAKAGVDFVNLAAENIVSWGDGDTEDKYVTITTLPTSNYTLSKQFTVKVAALTTGAYAGYAKPAIAGATATAKLMNKTVGVTSAAFAKTVAGVGGITMASTGTWFVGKEEGELRSGTGNGTLTYTLTGPGFFAFKTPKIVNDSSDDSTAKLVCTIGTLNAKKALVASETIDCLGGETPDRVVRIVAAGSRVVRFTFSGGNGTEYAAFEDDDDTGLPFKWVQFSKVEMDEPMNKSVVTTNGLDSFTWKLPESLADENLYVSARLALTTSALDSYVSTVGEPGLCATEAELPEEYVLVPGKTYYWNLRFATSETKPDDMASLAWTAGPATWSFSVLKNGAPETNISGTDAYGDEISLSLKNGEPIRLFQGVKTQSESGSIIVTGTGANRYRLVAGKLPTGVSINSTTGKLAGAPSEQGTFKALLQSYNYKETKKNGKVTAKTYTYGTTVPLVFEVAPLGTAAGTFRAALVEGGSVNRKAAMSGFLTVSVTSAGKITATAKIAGNTYSFTGTGYDELLDEYAEEPGLKREFTVALQNVTKLTKTVSKKTVTTPYTNTIEIVVRDGELTNTVALAEAVGSARLVMNVPNNLVKSATACESDIVYEGVLMRADGAIDAFKTAVAEYAGYYTVALAPSGVSAADGVPLGNGYLTFTIGATGAVSFSGTLADGTAVSGSSAATFQGDDIASPADCALVIPVGWSDNTRSISGEIKLVWAEDGEGAGAPVVDSAASKLLWSRNAAAAASLDGQGFAIEIEPVGGWYNTTFNMQAYYLNSDLAIQAAGADELCALVSTDGALPGANYTFKEDATPNDLAVKLTGNKTSVASRSLVKESSTLLYDLAASVNPWSATYSYARATGLVSGTFTCWAETTNTTKQAQITKIPHKGVMLFNRGDSSVLDDNVWSAGYYLIQANKNWKASLPFNVVETPIAGGRDWNEVEVP